MGYIRLLFSEANPAGKKYIPDAKNNETQFITYLTI
jgi:hypothetical protein